MVNDQVLGGDGYEYGQGKIHLDSDKLEFRWSKNELTIINHGISPAQAILTASFDSSGQHWTQTN
jgi:hypothetical protein